MWTYRQKTGELLRDGNRVGAGYSGHGEGKDNPDLQGVSDVGPIPRGRWLVAALITETEKHGPYVLQLVPEYGTETFGRSGFLVHGDSIASAGAGGASRGCIVLLRPIRERIWTSGDRHLEVVSGLPADFSAVV